MSEAKHTPGPWKAHATNLARSGQTEYEIHWSEDGECVAEIVHGAPDAHLIAAAPEMLATLRKLEYWLDTDPEVIEALPGDERRDHMAKLGMIREVIAKAEGRS